MNGVPRVLGGRGLASVVALGVGGRGRVRRGKERRRRLAFEYERRERGRERRAYGQMNRIQSFQSSTNFTLSSFSNIFQEDMSSIWIWDIIVGSARCVRQGSAFAKREGEGERGDQHFEDHFGDF